MENNNPQKDIFDLSKQEFSSFFYKEIAPKINVSKIKLALEAIYTFIVYTLILIVWLGILLVMDYIMYPDFSERIPELMKKDFIHGIFILFVIAFWFAMHIMVFLVMATNIVRSFKLPNYKVKQSLFSLLNFNYLSSQKQTKWKGNSVYLPLIPAHVQKALRKIFVSSGGKQAFRYPLEEENLSLTYKELPAEIVEFQYPKDSRGFSNAIVVATKIGKNFKGEVIINDKIASFRPGVEIKPAVLLEATEFSKQFRVFADDQIEARYLLTTAFIDRMLNYKNSHNCNIDILFSNSLCKDKNIFICISGKKNFFEFSFLSNWNKDPSIFYNILSELKEILVIVEALKLDQDIGM